MIEGALAEIGLEVQRLFVAVALGLFLGLEREWSQKSAGIRTFSLVTLAGSVFVIVGSDGLLVVGGVLVVVHGAFLGVKGLADDEGLYLTTSISMFVAYGVGILVASGYVLEGVVVALLSSLLLVLKRELHEFARELSKEEVKSASELAILAFVIYPLLPTENMGPWNAVDPRTVWLLVIAMSAIGFVNYVIIQKFGSQGVGISGFFGGLVNSTAAVGEIASRARTSQDFTGLAVGGILLADAAMAFRNLLIIVVFVPELAFVIGIPLAAIALAGIALSLLMSDWDVELETEFESPFSLSNALKFGTLFLVVLIASAGAQELFGSTGFLATSFFSGLVSSGSVATTAVVLVQSGQLSTNVAAAGVLAGTVASILVKIALAASIERSIVRPVVRGSAALIAVGLLSMGAALAFA
ncbi:MgtC/SapB family protein [Halalkalicoccus subterraneus]|uniref:MgtC/SapB family protein n=1 Tax=Halalkalicoccus subterraneus TaxID=2675002 RepID=UPI000EFC8268|nr:MgtC/SapB family protein [Halalkalicoccus subterraneus]